MSRFNSKILFMMTLGLGLLHLSEASGGPLTCSNQPGKQVDLSVCKGSQDVLCVAAPQEGEEIVGGGACILAKFQKLSDVKRIADLVVSYDFTGVPVPDPMAQLAGPFLPDLKALASSGEFSVTVPLPVEGTYAVTIGGRLAQDDGSCKDISVSRTIRRLAAPHLTATKARACASAGGCSDDNSAPAGVSDMAGKDPAHSIRLTLPAARASDLQFCVNGHDSEVNAGQSVAVHAANHVVDSGTNPVREIQLDATCVEKGKTVCRASPLSDSFCPGGFVLNVPLAHGKNRIVLSIETPAGRETIGIDPLDVDLKGPDLCFSYRDGKGKAIGDVDGGNLLASETGGSNSVMLDVTLGACGAEPEKIKAASPEGCNPEDPPDCVLKKPAGQAPVCVKLNNGTKLLALCPSDAGDGRTHYRGRLGGLRFPINTATAQADDDLGNRTVRTSSFGYGDVMRPLFDGKGALSLRQALIPQALGGFVPASFITGELKKVILDAVNSPKFKNEFFPKLLDPHRPGPAESACLKSIENQVQCTYDHLDNPNRVVAIKMFCDNGRCEKIGKIDIPNLYLLNNDTVRVQLFIDGLRQRGEMYTIKFGEGDPDGFPGDEADLARRMDKDPDFGVYTLPIKFAVKTLRINLDVRLEKDQDGKLRVRMSQANVPGRDLIEAVPDRDGLIEFDCDKTESELVRGTPIDTRACKGLKDLNDSWLVNGAKKVGVVDDKQRRYQDTNKQFDCTMRAIALCSIPKQVESALDKFDPSNGDRSRVTAISQELFGKNFHLDFFAPLASANVSIDPNGIGFSGDGLLLPAGVTDSSDKSEKNPSDFFASLPKEFKNSKFGPLSEQEGGLPPDPPDPIDAAFSMGGELDLSLKEETINSLLHSVGLLLWDLDRFEEKRSLPHRTLDLSARRLKEDFGLKIPDIGQETCKNENGMPDPREKGENWRCFPFPLTVQNIFGGETLKYVDFNGDGEAGDTSDIQAPVLIRSAVSPFSPPTVRIVSVSPTEVWDKNGHPRRAEIIKAEIEIGVGDLTMSVFEERVKDWNATVIEGTGELKSWCDHFPKVDTDRCPRGIPVPIVSFKASGRLFITLFLDNKDPGIIRAEGGLSSVERPGAMPGTIEFALDSKRTYLEFSAAENNTIVSGNELAAAMKDKVNNLLLANYAFGLKRDVRLNIPVQVPLEDFCALYSSELPDFCKCFDNDPSNDGDDCGNASVIKSLWDKIGLSDFGVNGLRVVHPLLGVTGGNLGPTRYLTIGADVDFNPARPAPVHGSNFFVNQPIRAR